jgi:hypothetical protein
VHVVEEIDGALRPAGQIRYGFAGKGLWEKLDRLRAGPSRKGIVPVRLGMFAESNTSDATRAATSVTA